MRVLVTGGAGYIGSVVVEELIREGYEAIVYDNLSKGHRDAVIKPARFVQGDLRDGETLLTTFQDLQPEAVIHMVADALVGESVHHPARYYQNNVVAGLVLLDVMRDMEVRHLVFSSTCAVYGEPVRHPIQEGDPTAPTNPYGESKLVFERALFWYSVAYGLRYASLRYFNAAGATERNGERHDPETHLIPIVLNAIAGLGPPVTIFGNDYPTKDGTCVRDYIHVSDLARAHVLALQALNTGNGNRIYNLGCGGAGYTVLEVIDVARRVTGRDVPTTVGPRRVGDPAVLVASSSKIREELGWEPKLQDLATIIESAWAWMKTHRL